MTERAKNTPELEDLEIDLLVQAVDRLHGIDLRQASALPVRKRIWEAVKKERARTISGLQEKLLHDPEALRRFVRSVLPPFVPYSAGFLQKFRYDIIPRLRTYPFVRIWQVGCNSVFETYCLSIILAEEGLAGKSTIYGTDLNERFVENCYNGIFSLDQLEKYEKVYQKSGGRRSLSDYFSGGGSQGLFDTYLRRNMVFSRHHLGTDGSFNECHAVFCRNPIKFYDRPMQEKAHRVIYESLIVFGILGLTQGETLENAATAAYYEELDQEHNLYRKSVQPC